MEIQGKSQVEGEAKVQEAGAETPQSTEQAPVTGQPGAETVSQKTTTAPVKPAAAAPKTYTEEEVRQREAQITSKLQAETAQARAEASRLALAQQAQALAQVEQQAQSKDQTDVANGVITENEAVQRRDQRTQALQKQAEEAQLRQALQAQMERGEQLGRITMAHDLGTKYGVSPELLLKDTAIKTPLEMVQKASELALADRDAKLRALTAKPESFDTGPGAESVGGDDSKLSARELALKAYSTKK